MKDLIKKAINEVVGVPENIIESAVRLYEDIKKEITSVIDTNITEYNFVIEPDEPYIIGDMNINEADVDLTIYPTDIDYYDFAEMGVMTQYSKEVKNKKTVLMSVNKEGKTKLNMALAVPEDWTEQGVIDYINKSKVSTVSSLTHELKHEYDDFKKPISKLSDRAYYVAARELMGSDIRPFNRLMFDLYYFTNIENLVRPSELAAKVKIGGVTKKEFRDFIRDEYDRIREIRNFNVNDFITELKNYIPNITKIFDDMDIDYSNMSEDGIIEKFMEMIYITFSSNQFSTYKNTIIDNMFEKLFGLGIDPEKTKELENYQRKIRKYENNPIEFFYHLQSDLNRTGEKMIRKLSKIYSLIEE